MNTLIIYRERDGKTHLVVVEGDYKNLNGVSLNSTGIVLNQNQSILVALIYDENGDIKNYGYCFSTDNPLSLELLEANRIKFVIFCRGD